MLDAPEIVSVISAFCFGRVNKNVKIVENSPKIPTITVSVAKEDPPRLNNYIFFYNYTSVIDLNKNLRYYR